jgi:hypothetical protein
MPNTLLTTASSSIGLSEQVEYIINPPTFNISNPFINNLFYTLWSYYNLLTFQSFHFLPNLRIAPSPEQGTSHNTLSK